MYDTCTCICFSQSQHTTYMRKYNVGAVNNFSVLYIWFFDSDPCIITCCFFFIHIIEDLKALGVGGV